MSLDLENKNIKNLIENIDANLEDILHRNPSLDLYLLNSSFSKKLNILDVHLNKTYCLTMMILLYLDFKI
jgi:hypothetical protein